MNVHALMDRHKLAMDAQTATTEQLKSEIETMKEDFAEVINQIVEDADQEELNIKKKNEQNVAQVKDMELRSNAELLMTTTKLSDLEIEIDQLDREIITKEKQLELQRQEKGKLEADIETMKQQIDEKDNQIGDKETKIYVLKKKTQELEKFKFVLDYKIKDLRKDIAPKATQIIQLGRETKEMDQKLSKYNQLNASLGFMVDDLKTKQDIMTEARLRNRFKRIKNDIEIKQMKTDVYWVVQYIDEFEELQKIVNKNLYKYVQSQDPKNVEVDEDIKKEQENQRRYLDIAKATLQKRLEKEHQIHKDENSHIMYENLLLIDQINGLRGKINSTKDLEKSLRTTAKQYMSSSKIARESRGGSTIKSDPEALEAME